MQRTVFSIFVAIVLALPCAGSARTDRELTYRENEIWNGAIRFLRVDSGFKILEKDRDAGYVLFEYRDAGAAPCSASFEMVRTVKDGRSFVRARLQISQMPRYVEAVLIDKLVRKLKEEYGDPPPAAVVRPEEKPATQAPAGKAEAGKGAEGKSPADGEQDPEAGDEAELEPTEDDIESSAEEG